MSRIAIIGNAGGGKSLLARHLGQSLGLPFHAIDDLRWGFRNRVVHLRSPRERRRWPTSVAPVMS